MIPLSVPNLAGNEWAYVKECLDTGWISSVGEYVSQFEQAVAGFAGAKFGVATVNGTAALHIALHLSGVRSADYVIVPNITFVASLNAVRYTGADPLIIDVAADNWQMDLDLLEEFLTTETRLSPEGTRIYIKNGRVIRAIMPVHVLGNIGDMHRVMALAKAYNLEVVEDATEALGSYYRGKHSGTFGRMGCFSFNGNKIISTGGGGVIITDDEGLARTAKHLTTTAKKSTTEYFHDEVGYNYRLVNVLAAIGVAQMEQLPTFITRKKQINAFYRSMLAGVGDIAFQQVASDVDANCWLFTIATGKQRSLLQHLAQQKIQARPFWVPMNELPMYTNAPYVTRDNRAAGVYRSCISIPSSTGISDENLKAVVKAVKQYFV